MHARTRERLKKAQALEAEGWTIGDACAETGLHLETWARRTPRAASDDRVAREVLAIVTEIRKAVA